MKCVDITGKQFSRLTVICRAPNRGAKVVWECRCSCGDVSFARTSDLNSGKHKSCGCLQRETVTKHGHTKHGSAPTPEYRSWICMKDRCTNPNATGYAWYGERDITICKEWMESFEIFFADMGKRPTLKHTLDRIDNDGNYEPSNCKWSTRKEQAQNRRKATPSPRNRGTNGRFTPGPYIPI